MINFKLKTGIAIAAIITVSIFMACGKKNSTTTPSPSPTPTPTPGATTVYPTRVILEDHTGTWCGHCPRLGAKLDAALTTYPKLIGITIHNGDAMATSFDGPIRGINGVTGFPTGVINRAANWNETEGAILPYLNATSNIGVAIESTVAGAVVSGKVKILNGKAYTNNYKIHILLVEDNLIYNQTNYGYNGQPNPIVNKVHNDVLRLYSTNVQGDDIPVANKTFGNVYEQNFTFNTAGFNLANCKIIAYVTANGAKEILNANEVKAGLSAVATL